MTFQPTDLACYNPTPPAVVLKDLFSMETRGPSPKALSLVRSFSLAFVFVLAALIPELFIAKYFFPYPFLYPFLAAVVASAWFGGMAGGLFAVILSIVAVDYFFIPPVNSLTFSAAVVLYLASFVVCALAAGWVSSAIRRSELALKEARDQLEVRVVERTAALMKTEAELTRLSRVLSMGELTASIAHEIKQPLTAVVMNGHASIEWLSASPPNLEKVRQSTEKIIQDGTRAGAVLSRIRALFKKETSTKDWLEMNDVIQELVGLVRAEAQKQNVTLRLELASDLPKLLGDRGQLQQVVLNLMMNGIDAIAAADKTSRELLVSSWKQGEEEIGVRVEDNGVGLDPENAEKIFDPFFTTKPHGIGMGLSISRTIVESHEGKLWATVRPAGGTIFQFTIPVHAPK